MAAPATFCLEVPAGGFSGMLAGGGFDVDLTRVLDQMEDLKEEKDMCHIQAHIRLSITIN
ncbi:hypothetical protein DVH24_042726 [Malus domestica]|uniref:Uncharacterized protein n=1 Tax=Malus domestica TaxID=3750 RepID=A0A498HZ74_MALDO|nr:hypothetical protein DVH24_042726 [Malus domestica]